MTSTTTSADGTTIAFDRYGDGANAIVLVGGAFQHRAIDGTTATLAQQLADATGRSVAHYDRRGRGDSGDTPPYGVQREVEDLAAVIGEMDGDVSAYGMSSGGVLALEGVRAGLPISRLAVYEPPLRVASTPPPPERFAERVDELVAAGRRDEAIQLFMGDMIAPEAFEGWKTSPIFAAFEAVAHTLAYDGRLLDFADGADGRTDLARYAETVTIPVLVANGAEGEGWMAEGADALAAALPDARRETLAGQSHEVDTAVLAPLLASFFGAP